MSTTLEPRGIHRRIQFQVTESLRQRFTAKVNRGNDDKCWRWDGAVRQGYGAIKHEGKVLGTHVVAYVIANGPVPEGRLVTHNCDNRLCCNPKHLVAGTFSSNSRESWDRRNVNATRGEKSPNAIFTNHDVQLLRAFHLVKGYGAVKLGKLFGFNKNSIKNVIGKKNWAHLPWPTQEEAEQLVLSHQLHS